MDKPSVLHIAPENTAGVPFNTKEMQSKFGLYTRLLTFYKVPFSFPEDICLNLSLPRSRIAMKWREFKQAKLQESLYDKNIDRFTHLPYYAPKNALEAFYIKLREKKNEKRFLAALEGLRAGEFDIFHFDGGIDFYSDCRMARMWKKEGKKIVNCYFGDDLRTRGVVKQMDELSDLNLTFEYDHTLRHPNIHFLFFPFENASVRYITDEEYSNSRITRIVHAPTNRIIKGTRSVIEAVKEIKRYRDVELVLLEGLPREKVIELKASCHIAIDQIGNRGGTGYGINSLEYLSMGIPTITDMNCGMNEWLPENPFVVADEITLKDRLIDLIDNREFRTGKRVHAREWVEKYHSYGSVFSRMKQLYEEHGILK